MNWLKKIYARLLPSSKFQVATETFKIQKLHQTLLQEISALEQKEEKHYQDTVNQFHIISDVLDEIKHLCIHLDSYLEKRKDSLNNVESDASCKADRDLGGLITTLLTASNNIDSIMKKIDFATQKSTDLDKKMNTLMDSVNEIDHIYQYNNNYERKINDSFNEYYDAPNYREQFLRLIEGLDSESIDELVKILQRQHLIRDTRDQKLDLYSFEEQKLIKDMKRKLNKEIYRIDDGMYCFKHWFLPINHFEASVFIYQHGIDCIKNINDLRNKDILDVGGFIGDSILILKPLTSKRVISFEAVLSNFELMKKTVAMNHLDNVILEHAALGDSTTTTQISVSGSESSFHTNGIVKVDCLEEVCMFTLDDYMKDKDYDIGLIKVDIEGAEQSFLCGAYATIKKFRPVLLISIYNNADDFFNIKPLIDNWNLGYKFKIHKPTDNTISKEVLLIAEVI